MTDVTSPIPLDEDAEPILPVPSRERLLAGRS